MCKCVCERGRERERERGRQKQSWRIRDRPNTMLTRVPGEFIHFFFLGHESFPQHGYLCQTRHVTVLIHCARLPAKLVNLCTQLWSTTQNVHFISTQFIIFCRCRQYSSGSSSSKLVFYAQSTKAVISGRV